jgi:hypothetical protein
MVEAMVVIEMVMGTGQHELEKMCGVVVINQEPM